MVTGRQNQCSAQKGRLDFDMEKGGDAEGYAPKNQEHMVELYPYGFLRSMKPEPSGNDGRQRNIGGMAVFGPEGSPSWEDYNCPSQGTRASQKKT
jgi:hypothetical protein